jgi:hypothetical protein
LDIVIVLLAISAPVMWSAARSIDAPAYRNEKSGNLDRSTQIHRGARRRRLDNGIEIL